MNTPTPTKRYEIKEGRASWHQQKAGHFYAATGIHRFTEQELATFVANYRRHSPHEPLHIREIPCSPATLNH